jgi:hypothetical protein
MKEDNSVGRRKRKGDMEIGGDQGDETRRRNRTGLTG